MIKGVSFPAPLRHARFRRLWLSMSASYAGDRLQQLAQGWLVATLTDSALAVGALGVLGSLPLLLSPLGGVVADQVDRRRILVLGQGIGALSTGVVTVLLLGGWIEIWHLYGWAFVNGLILLICRPSYKVAVTESVPVDEVRSAVAINSMGETLAMVAVNAGGSVVLGLAGLPLAFLANTASYLVAAGSVWSLRTLGGARANVKGTLALKRLWPDLREGIVYLSRQPGLLAPLGLTFATLVAISPSGALLAAIVHGQEGTIVDLGLLGAAFSVGAFLGAGYAGARGAGRSPVRRYALLALLAAGALALFSLLPVSLVSALPLSVLGSIAFAEAVWNTSRVRRLADPAYQARVQSFTSMAFTLSFPLGSLWGGLAIDQFGVQALLSGAAVLALIAVVALLAARGPPEP